MPSTSIQQTGSGGGHHRDHGPSAGDHKNQKSSPSQQRCQTSPDVRRRQSRTKTNFNAEDEMAHGGGSLFLRTDPHSSQQSQANNSSFSAYQREARDWLRKYSLEWYLQDMLRHLPEGEIRKQAAVGVTGWKHMITYSRICVIGGRGDKEGTISDQKRIKNHS